MFFFILADALVNVSMFVSMFVSIILTHFFNVRFNHSDALVSLHSFSALRSSVVMDDTRIVPIDLSQLTEKGIKALTLRLCDDNLDYYFIMDTALSAPNAELRLVISSTTRVEEVVDILNAKKTRNLVTSKDLQLKDALLRLNLSYRQKPSETSTSSSRQHLLPFSMTRRMF
jgi:hypothetical protein